MLTKSWTAPKLNNKMTNSAQTSSITSSSTSYQKMQSNLQKQLHRKGSWELQMIYSIIFGLAFQTNTNQNASNNW